jgi:hypothetical protein
MKLIVYISLMFILYESLKLFMAGTYWRIACLKRRNKALKLLDLMYLLFLIYLFITPYWYVSIAILITSVITALQTTDDVIEKSKFNKRIRGFIIADNIVSILFLLIITLKELL